MTFPLSFPLFLVLVLQHWSLLTLSLLFLVPFCFGFPHSCPTNSQSLERLFSFLYMFVLTKVLSFVLFSPQSPCSLLGEPFTLVASNILYLYVYCNYLDAPWAFNIKILRTEITFFSFQTCFYFPPFRITQIEDKFTTYTDI